MVHSNIAVIIFFNIFLPWNLIVVSEQWQDSKLFLSAGHYPHFHCQVTNTVFSWKDRTFYYKATEDLASECDGIIDIWDIKFSTNFKPNCQESYDYGYAFTIYATYGGNYFHLHYDMMIPLYAEVYHSPSKELQAATKVFMPTIESHRLKSLTWDTPLFLDESKYWNQLTKAIVGDHTYRPLDQALLDSRKDVCFKTLNFGTRRTKFDDPAIMKGFARHMKSYLGISHRASPVSVKPKVGIISRSSRRRILNEDEVVNSLKSLADVELVRFEGMTFKQQVEHVQQYTVLAGINGAGLMNCVYLPPTSVCLQMVPYQAQVNWRDYGALLRARGPYVEWHNTHEHLTRKHKNDQYNNRPDTIIHTGDFRKAVEEALAMAAKETWSSKQEL